jgi:hypothetical protein
MNEPNSQAEAIKQAQIDAQKGNQPQNTYTWNHQVANDYINEFNHSKK